MESLRPSILARRKSLLHTIHLLLGRRADRGKAGREKPAGIALVPVSHDQVPDLHATPEGGTSSKSLLSVSAMRIITTDGSLTLRAASPEWPPWRLIARIARNEDRASGRWPLLRQTHPLVGRRRRRPVEFPAVTSPVVAPLASNVVPPLPGPGPAKISEPLPPVVTGEARLRFGGGA